MANVYRWYDNIGLKVTYPSGKVEYFRNKEPRSLTWHATVDLKGDPERIGWFNALGLNLSPKPPSLGR